MNFFSLLLPSSLFSLPSFLLVLCLAAKPGFTQDYSSSKKMITYSEEYECAKRYKDVAKALKEPEKVVWLELLIDKEGVNYKVFCQNIEKFTNLRKLVLTNWYEIDIPFFSGIYSLTKLEHLRVFNIIEYKFEGIGKLKNLKYLSIDGARLTSLPLEITTLEDLRFLEVSVCFLTTLPQEMANLKKLIELDLTNNCFEDIPEVIYKMNSLIWIEYNNTESNNKSSNTFQDGVLFCQNKLTRFPEQIKNMENLRSISLYRLTLDPVLKAKIQGAYKGTASF
jgi:Leucine-rich repeat (LRR) protein